MSVECKNNNFCLLFLIENHICKSVHSKTVQCFKKKNQKLPIEHVRYVEKCYYRQTIKDHLVIVLVIYDRVVMHSKQIVD